MAIAKFFIETKIFNSGLFSIPLVRHIIQKIEYFVVSASADNIFDSRYYLAHHPDVAASNYTPLEHYIKYGHKEGRNPCALFDGSYYRQKLKIGRHFPLTEMSHFMLYGCYRDISPSPWFDYEYYRRANRDVARSNINSYIHYLRFGINENRQATPEFDPHAYLKLNGRTGAGRQPAILHYLDNLGSQSKYVPGALISATTLSHSQNSEDLIDDIMQTLIDLDPAINNVDPEVDIIIPVYRDILATLRCIHSVLNAQNTTRSELIVIDDQSPEPELAGILQKLAAIGHFDLITHQENLGFVKSVNEGMRLHTDRDVILLNSDTEVYHNWIDRLVEAAQSAPEISTVTPLTNNGTICSYPQFAKDNPYPLEISYSEIDRIADEVNKGIYVNAPTAVGFCMYIRRQALRNIGYFDAQAFGKGYGEENDYCLRGQAKGWTDIIATNIFVRHLGAISFGERRQEQVEQALKIISKRYPTYRDDVQKFIANDPLREARSNIDLARLKRLKKKKNTLLISHQRGGGTEQNIQEDSFELDQLGRSQFRLYTEKKKSNLVHLTHSDAPNVPNLKKYNILTDQAELERLFIELDIGSAQIHHLVELPVEAPAILRKIFKGAKIPYTFVLHDYLSICPRINLIDEKGVYCGEPDHGGCRDCLIRRGSDFNIIDIAAWRSGYGKFLKDARLVIAPNIDVERRMKRYFPEANIGTIPHDTVKAAPLKLRTRAKGAPIRIGVLGAISQIKGYDLIVEAARLTRKNRMPIEFCVVGYTKNDRKARQNGIMVTGPYSNENVLDLVASVDVDCIFLPSLSPETFSYTLSTALQTGLPIAAFDLGAIAERLKNLRHSYLLPLADHKDPKRVAKNIKKFVLECEKPEGSGVPPLPDHDEQTTETLNGLLARNNIEKARYTADMTRLKPAPDKYVIFFTPRSGSSHLTEMLTSTKTTGIPEEWFNPNWIAKVAEHLNAADLSAYIEMITRHKQSANGVFGSELTYFQYRSLAESIDFFSHFPITTKFFFLYRDDIISQGISLYKAVKSGLFHSVNSTQEQRQKAESEIIYDGDEIKNWIEHIRQQEAGCFRLITDNALSAKIMTYEEMFSTSQSELVMRMHAHLGIEPSTLAKSSPSRHHKIGTQLNEVMRKRFIHENGRFVKKLDKERKQLLKAGRLEKYSLLGRSGTCI